MVSQNLVGNLLRRPGWELLAVHLYKHIKGGTQKVSAAYTGIEQGQAFEGEVCRGIQLLWFHIVRPGCWQCAVWEYFVIAATKAILQEPLHHIRFCKKLCSGSNLSTRTRFPTIAQLGIDQGFVLFLIKLIGPAYRIGISKCSICLF